MAADRSASGPGTDSLWSSEKNIIVVHCVSLLFAVLVLAFAPQKRFERDFCPRYIQRYTIDYTLLPRYGGKVRKCFCGRVTHVSRHVRTRHGSSLNVFTAYSATEGGHGRGLSRPSHDDLKRKFQRFSVEFGTYLAPWGEACPRIPRIRRFEDVDTDSQLGLHSVGANAIRPEREKKSNP